MIAVRALCRVRAIGHDDSWIEAGPQGTTVVGELGQWTAHHPVEAIALCMAALDARRAELSYAH